MFRRNHVVSVLSVIAGFITLIVTGTTATDRLTSALVPVTRLNLRGSLISATPMSDVSLVPVQPAIVLSGIEQEYQGWNNCGPATLKMDLGYFGRNDTQQDIAAFTKPDPNDKNVRA